MPDEQVEELKFPIDFDACPKCGSKRKVAQELIEQEKKKGKAGEDMRGAVIVQRTLIADGRRTLLSALMLTAMIEICYDCGTLYCVHAETAITQIQTGAPMPKGGPTQFKFLPGSPGHN